MKIDISLLKLKELRFLKTNQEMIDYMVAIDKVENSVKYAEYIPYLVAGIDNATNEREITASAVTTIEDIIAENDVSMDSVLAFLNSSLVDYDNKYEFLDEIYFALLNYCINDNVLVDCYKSLTKQNQEKLKEILNVLKEEDKAKYEPVIEAIIK